jgi:hypothetical protein
MFPPIVVLAASDAGVERVAFDANEAQRTSPGVATRKFAKIPAARCVIWKKPAPHVTNEAKGKLVVRVSA